MFYFPLLYLLDDAVHNIIMTSKGLLPTSNLGLSRCTPLGGSRSLPLLFSWVAWGDFRRRSPLLCRSLWHRSRLHISFTWGCSECRGRCLGSLSGSLGFLQLLLCLLRIT